MAYVRWLNARGAIGLVALIAIAWLNGKALAQASPAAASTTVTPTARKLMFEQQVEPAPSAFWLVAGIVLGGGGLVLDMDSARRVDDGDPSCFPVLEPGGCLVEALVAGPVGLGGGVSLLLYGKWLGEHDASLALASGQPLADHGSLETWSLITVLGGIAIAASINYYAIGRLYSDREAGRCEDAARADRAEACAGGKLFTLSIVQSIAYAIALIGAEPLGYAVGYDSVRRDRDKKARAALLPWAQDGGFGLSLGVTM